MVGRPWFLDALGPVAKKDGANISYTVPGPVPVPVPVPVDRSRFRSRYRCRYRLVTVPVAGLVG